MSPQARSSRASAAGHPPAKIHSKLEEESDITKAYSRVRRNCMHLFKCTKVVSRNRGPGLGWGRPTRPVTRRQRSFLALDEQAFHFALHHVATQASMARRFFLKLLTAPEP
jgi:hypothetical protein